MTGEHTLRGFRHNLLMQMHELVSPDRVEGETFLVTRQYRWRRRKRWDAFRVFVCGNGQYTIVGGPRFRTKEQAVAGLHDALVQAGWDGE
jgi:hypothetical protein